MSARLAGVYELLRFPNPVNEVAARTVAAGVFATRVAAPRIGHANPVAGPPKRFAQGMGAVMSLATVVAHFGFGADGLSQVLLGMIVAAATLESVLAFCVGCTIFAGLMRAGLIPAQTCEACANVSLRLPTAA